jgi:hypothetical protein
MSGIIKSLGAGRTDNAALARAESLFDSSDTFVLCLKGILIDMFVPNGLKMATVERGFAKTRITHEQNELGFGIGGGRNE